MFDRRAALIAAVTSAALLVAPAGAKRAANMAQIGQTISVNGPRVTPLAVVEDSRCPADVDCVWAGRIRVKVRILGGRKSFVRILELRSPVQVFDGQLTLDSVSPTRHSRQKLYPSQYRFHFSFAGGL